MHSELIVVQRP